MAPRGTIASVRRAACDVARLYSCRLPCGRISPRRSAIRKRVRLTTSAPALQKRALPCQRVRDDGREIVVSRLPSERGTRALACRDDLRGIARPAAGEFDREIHAGDPLYGLDHVEHGEAAAVAAIERARGAAAAQVSERGAMRGDE